MSKSTIKRYFIPNLLPPAEQTNLADKYLERANIQQHKQHLATWPYQRLMIQNQPTTLPNITVLLLFISLYYFYRVSLTP